MQPDQAEYVKTWERKKPIGLWKVSKEHKEMVHKHNKLLLYAQHILNA